MVEVLSPVPGRPLFLLIHPLQFGSDTSQFLSMPFPGLLQHDLMRFRQIVELCLQLFVPRIQNEYLKTKCGRTNHEVGEGKAAGDQHCRV